MNPDAPPVLLRSDFDRCFVGEPDEVPAALVLLIARRSLRRRRLLVSLVAVVAAVVISLIAVSNQRISSLLLPRPDTAVPSPPSVAVQPPPSLHQSASPPPPTLASEPTGKDTAPELVWKAQGGYRDRAGLTAVDEQGDPFTLTMATLRATVHSQLDPSRQHLKDGESSMGSDGSYVNFGQKFSWTIPGEPGEGSIETALARRPPEAAGEFEQDYEGLCSSASARCASAQITGVEVTTGALPSNGFVIDLVQGDGEIASIVVKARANDSEVPLSKLPISQQQAVSLLLNHQLDVVG